MIHSPFIIQIDPQFLTNHPHLIGQSRQLTDAYETKATVIEDEVLQSVGESLWQALDCEGAFEQEVKASGQAVVNIVIESDDAKVQALAWETLHHPKYGFVGRDKRFTLSRRIPMKPSPQLPEPECAPLRILLFASMPMDLGEDGRLQVEEEKASILQAVTSLEKKGLVELICPDDGRFESFCQVIQEFKPHLVYLTGHGTLHHDTLENAFQGQFLFEDTYACSLPVADEEVASCFTNTTVQAVVLSACESGKFDARALNNGLTILIARKGIPHVIGMRESILDNAGLEFATTFLKEVANKGSVPLALQRARDAIHSHITRYLSVFRKNEPARNATSKQQWCLPSLITHDISQPLVDWSFTPSSKGYTISLNESLNNITVPEQFLGRRREWYKLFTPLLEGTRREVLLTAAGGMGKTALAGKLCQQLRQKGFEVFAFSTRESSAWLDFITELELALNEHYTKQYDTKKTKMSEKQQAQALFKYLLNQHQGKVVLFLDNLESVQDMQSRELTEDRLRLWLNEARNLTKHGLRLILTSRWCLPDWEGEAHHALEKPVYSDFIAFSRQRGLLATLRDGQLSREVYDVLGGNFRAFEFFVSATNGMKLKEAEVFLQTLSQAKAESQTDMALEQVLSQRSELEKALLVRMLAYPVAVPIKGVSIIAIRVSPTLSENTEHIDAINTLTNLSLVECIDNEKEGSVEYQVSPLIRDYLHQHNKVPSAETLNIAAYYLHDELLGERPTLDLALTVYQALVRSKNTEAAQRLLLYKIAPYMNTAGLYNTLLGQYLIPSLSHSHEKMLKGETLNLIGKQCLHTGKYHIALKRLEQARFIFQEIGGRSEEAVVLNNISQTYQAQGNYNSALTYLQQALTIQNDIGDRPGEATTLNNIGLNYHVRGDYPNALTYLQNALTIRREIGDGIGEGTTLNNISQTYKARGNCDTAMNYLKQALAAAQASGHREGEARALNNISQIYDMRGNFGTARAYLKQALAIWQKIGNRPGESSTLNNIATIYQRSGDNDNALAYLNQALTIQQKIGDRSGEGTTLNNISIIYIEKNDYDNARSNLQQALKIQQDIGDRKGEGTTLNNISQIYDRRGDYDTALTYLQKALAIRQDIDDKQGLCSTLFNIGHIFFRKGDHPKAFSAWLNVYILAKLIGDAQALRALENLAPQVGLKGGLNGWAALAEKLPKNYK